MKNVFVEGIQGSGKTTMVSRLSAAIPQLHVYKEGAYSPVELAWCAWMTRAEYEAALLQFADMSEVIRENTFQEEEHLIVTYTRIPADDPFFYQYFERYEIYNARKSLETFKRIVFDRYRRFSQTGCLFECSFFQNIMEELILFQLCTDDEIIRFYWELYQLVHQEHFLLVYLQNGQIEESIQKIRLERCDETGKEAWYLLMMEYLIHSPYGQKKGLHSMKDLIAHFEHRQELELRVIREVIGECAVVIPAKQYELDDALLKRVHDS